MTNDERMKRRLQAQTELLSQYYWLYHLRDNWFATSPLPQVLRNEQRILEYLSVPFPTDQNTHVLLHVVGGSHGGGYDDLTHYYPDPKGRSLGQVLAERQWDIENRFCGDAPISDAVIACCTGTSSSGDLRKLKYGDMTVIPSRKNRPLSKLLLQHFMPAV